MLVRTFHRHAVVFAVAALISASFSLTGCDNLQKTQERLGLKNKDAHNSETEVTAKTSAATGSARSYEPSSEVKEHVKQGLTHVSAAKNARNKALFDENIDNALKEFSLAIEKAPDYAEAYSNRGAAFMQQRKYNKALEDLKKAKELKPDSPSICYNLACLYSLTGDVDFGLDELDAALANGFNDYDSLRRDSDLNRLRKHPEFTKVLEKYKIFFAK